MSTHGQHLTPQRRRELAESCRKLAAEHERRAQQERQAGDPGYAAELEAAAVDATVAAEHLELAQ